MIIIRGVTLGRTKVQKEAVQGTMLALRSN